MGGGILNISVVCKYFGKICLKSGLLDIIGYLFEIIDDFWCYFC